MSCLQFFKLWQLCVQCRRLHWGSGSGILELDDVLHIAKLERKGSLTYNLNNRVQILSATTLLYTPQQRNLSFCISHFHIKFHFQHLSQGVVWRLKERTSSRGIPTMSQTVFLFYADFLPCEEIKYVGRRFGIHYKAQLKSKLWLRSSSTSFDAPPLYLDASPFFTDYQVCWYSCSNTEQRTFGQHSTSTHTR